ncbi:MAG: hypothetical protein C0501_24065 [Isosphaera sp.]|nr:hypothetical protein [Isosphaera sp.]
MSRVVLGLLVGFAAGGLAAGWLVPRSSADVPAPAPREAVPADPQLNKLARLEAALVREVEAREDKIKRLAADGLPDGRVAALRARVNEQDAAIQALGRDIARTAAERRAQAKHLAEAPKHDPEVVAARVKRDPRVEEAEAVRVHVLHAISNAEGLFVDPVGRERSPAVLKARADLPRVEKRLADLIAAVTREVEEALTKKATGASKAEIARLDAKLEVDADVRDTLTADLKALRRALAAAEESRFEAEKMLDELRPLREELSKVRLEMIRLRAGREPAGK